jgi:hypothetical protein
MPFKDSTKKKEYHNNYMKTWKEKNKDRWKEIQDKSESRPERREYVREWQNTSPKFEKIKEKFKEAHPNIQKQYDKDFKERHPDRVKVKYEKYYNSIKGIINRLKKADKKKFDIENNNINFKLITDLDVKFLICPYCNGDFKPRFDYDHLNPFKPFSESNIVKVCSKCNQSKNNANLLEWMAFKKLNVSNTLKEMYSKSYELI